MKPVTRIAVLTPLLGATGVYPFYFLLLLLVDYGFGSAQIISALLFESKMQLARQLFATILSSLWLVLPAILLLSIATAWGRFRMRRFRWLCVPAAALALMMLSLLLTGFALIQAVLLAVALTFSAAIATAISGPCRSR